MSKTWTDSVDQEISRLEQALDRQYGGVSAGVVKTVFWLLFGLYFVSKAHQAGEADARLITLIYLGGLAALASLTLIVWSVRRRTEAELQALRELAQDAGAEGVWPPVPREPL